MQLYERNKRIKFNWVEVKAERGGGTGGETRA